ncbi:hypothetical protein [Natronosalvus vescus]|uniref:hypothetical protein n=1 Tax=Natronosalvus vescus TaxID=2953881 RepID=UPI0020912236|nr:hypothetical protein [Natronosalvus vescus]
MGPSPDRLTATSATAVMNRLDVRGAFLEFVAETGGHGHTTDIRGAIAAADDEAQHIN